MYKFKYVLLDRETVDEFIRVLNRPEPSGYGAVPSEEMNVAYGVEEECTGIILTLGYEENSRYWRGKEGDHDIAFYVKCNDGVFFARFDTNAYWDYVDNAIIYSAFKTEYLRSKYTDVVRNAIKFYMQSNNAYKKFCNEFKATHDEELWEYKNRIFDEVYNDWKKKWD